MPVLAIARLPANPALGASSAAPSVIGVCWKFGVTGLSLKSPSPSLTQHAACTVSGKSAPALLNNGHAASAVAHTGAAPLNTARPAGRDTNRSAPSRISRSEEHTSALQSLINHTYADF